MEKRIDSRGLSLLMLLVLAVTLFLLGRPDSSHAKDGEPEAEAKPVEVTLHDLELLDQDGRKVRFASDVIGGRIAVIDTIFTNCGLICPIISAIFADVQEQLGERMGTDVVLVSITVDPVTDIPPRLKKFAEGWEAKPGWVFLTGQKQTVDRVLEGLGLYSADFAAHPAAFLVGDGLNGKWTRYYGFATPGRLKSRVDELLSARQAKAG